MVSRRAEASVPAIALFGVVVAVVILGSAIFASATNRPTPPGPNTAVSDANGLRLEASVNSTQLAQGHALKVSLNLTNTQPWDDTVPTASRWPFEGVPVALWPSCYYVLPIQVVVLKGSFTLDDLRSVATHTSNYMCMEGGTMKEVFFQPKSDQVRIAGNVCVANCNYMTLGPYRLEFNFTTTGYWDLQALTSELNPPILGALTPGSLPSLPFAPGVYTVGVADEWGQAVVLHVTVGSSSTSMGGTCTISAEPTGFFLHLVPDSGVGRIPGLIVQAIPMVECGGSTMADMSAEAKYVTNGSGWVVASIPSVSGNFYLVYSFEFSGHEYNVAAGWQPEKGTFTTVGLPSGSATTAYIMPKNCNFTCTY
jgi:hypothetical protein